ncbi:MAG: hypothetical protein GDA56_06345 [Hormoscilla sp. GM7CHS1pb]|nr:hypothetical protein [Hormoscilla sp. GM7CHS1pb]
MNQRRDNSEVRELSHNNCSNISYKWYQPIQVFRYDRRLKTIYIQTGVNDEIALVIDEDGSWEFVI